MFEPMLSRTQVLFYYGLISIIAFTGLRYLSQSFSRIWFSRVYKYVVTPFLRRGSDHIRAKLLTDISNLTPKDPTKPLKILEVGAALGLNFRYYPSGSRVTAVEINEYFEKYYKENETKFSKVSTNFVVGNVEDMRDIADESVDVVVATYLLCTVQNTRPALSEIKRVLRTGGTYFFLEHSWYPRDTIANRLMASVQKLVSPVWYTLFEGCQLCLRQEQLIRRAGFESCKFNYEFPPQMFFLTRCQMWGTAVK